ncbi:MAG: VTC domain-containing protein [Peptococcaceae bacterium]|nr:VTC domain-containing protein [Peptococcaceae bacterium]
MQFRHEVKHEVSNLDLLVLRQRLRTVMTPDRHAVNGAYKIRSVYFDSFDDKALREKLDGVMIREKYRLRLYNDEPATLHLERKYKWGWLQAGCCPFAGASLGLGARRGGLAGGQ